MKKGNVQKVFRPLHFFHIVILIYSKMYFIFKKLNKKTSIYTQYPIITKPKEVFWQIYKKQVIHINCQTVYFVEAPLAAIIAWSLLGYTSLAHLYFGNFSHCSLQILSSSLRFDGEVSPEMFNRMAGPLKDIHRCHSCVVLVVCSGPFSCWKVYLHPSLRSWAGCHHGCLCTLFCSSFPRSWLVSQFQPLKNIPTACLP